MIETIIIIVIIVTFVILILWIISHYGKKFEHLSHQYHLQSVQHLKELEEARKDAVKKSKSVTRGHVSEQIIPVLDGFPYLLSDCKFSGAPFDYTVFDGMSDFRDGDKNKEISVIFADVKTGNSRRTPVQNAIKKAIEAGRVRYEQWEVNENNQLNLKS